MSDRARIERADRLRPFFELQLRFAEAVAAATGMPLSDAIAGYTNAHRRLGLGRIEGGETAPEWKAIVEDIVAGASLDARLDRLMQAFALAEPEKTPPHELRSGCFGLEAPTAQGVARIHFNVLGRRDAIGPLRRERQDERRAELERLFSALRDAHPEARSVRGGSWLYHFQAYRRLFPPAYVASIRPLERSPRFDGTSSWGQFLDHRERVKPELAEAFVRDLPRLDPDRLWLAFPLPALAALAPVSVFYAHYGIAPAG